MALVDAVPFVVANWPLNEASGNALDAVGSNTLTDNNGVGSAAGKLYSLARTFTGASSQSLTHADNSTLRAGTGDWMVRFWVMATSDPGASGAYLVVKRNTTAGATGMEYGVAIASTRSVALIVSNGTTNTSVTNPATLSLNTWYLIHAWHDAANDLIGISVDAGTPEFVAHSTGTANLDGTFTLGKHPFQDTLNFTGRLQDVVWMKGRYLTGGERTEDYNSGNGIAFLDWDGDNSSSSSPSSASSESSSSTSSDSSQSSESSSDSSESSSASSESSSASSESSSASSESSSASSGSSSDSSESSSASSESSSESSSDSSQSSSSSQSDSSTDSSSSSGLGRPRFGFPLLYWGDWW